MSVNTVTLQARIPFDLEIKNEDDDKKAFLGFTVSVRRNYKPDGEEYYPEDLLYCKAFGQTAKFINNYFGKGSNLILQGELRRDEDYEKDGETQKGQMYVHIVPGGVHFQNGNGESSGSNSGGGSKSSSKKPAGKSSASKSGGKAPGKKLNPLAKKKAII
ncbi:single-stranded DNA-binding protein [Bacillus atrophaeus]|uniref:single-stranded DNA-binding protein n=1 Tax=Bacillus atrophaeus TaxID=1452 RepID=UPI002E1C0448|nr:single-stranded DNA-binding protein [Bacillus atrophaeus]